MAKCVHEWEYSGRTACDYGRIKACRKCRVCGVERWGGVVGWGPAAPAQAEPPKPAPVMPAVVSCRLELLGMARYRTAPAPPSQYGKWLQVLPGDCPEGEL